MNTTEPAYPARLTPADYIVRIGRCPDCGWVGSSHHRPTCPTQIAK